MSYDKIRNRVYKTGGKVRFLQKGSVFSDPDQQSEYMYLIQNGYTPEAAKVQIERDARLDVADYGENAAFKDIWQAIGNIKIADQMSKDDAAQKKSLSRGVTDGTGRSLQETEKAANRTANENAKSEGDPDGSSMNAKTVGIISEIGAGAARVLDEGLMGDKNFGAQSEAIDSAVHGVSGALMKSGDPYCVCAGTKIYTDSGYKNIEDLQKSDKVLGYNNKQAKFETIEVLFPVHMKECIQIETECGNILRCSKDHPIYSALEGRAGYITVGKKRQRRIQDFQFRPAESLKVGDKVAEIGEIPIFGNKHVKLAYLIGMLIGDGTYGKRKVPRLFTADPDTWKYVEDNNLGKCATIYLPGKRYNKEFREYMFHGMQNVLREHGIYGQTKKNKTLPVDIESWDKESVTALIAGLIDMDGTISEHSGAGITFYQANLDLILQVKRLLLKLGIHSTISTYKEKNKIIKGCSIHSGVYYGLVIKRRESVINFYNNIHLNITYKQKRLTDAYFTKLAVKGRDTSLKFHNVIADKISRIVLLGWLPVYNVQVSDSHTFIADNIITHNCMVAGAALEGVNFMTKAGGDTVQGFDVDINNSGYGNLGHMQSSSSRDWSFVDPVGFGQLFSIGRNKKLQAKLNRRNEQAQMALTAAQISQDQKFEQEARTNNITNVLMNNQIALAGGVDTQALGS